MGSVRRSSRPLLIPLSAQGHWGPFLQFIRLCARQSVSLTVWTTTIRVEELQRLKAQGSFGNADIEAVAMFQEIRKPFSSWFHVQSMAEDIKVYKGKGAAPEGFSCIVSDMFLGEMSQELADEWEIPRWAFFTSPSYFALFMLHFGTLKDGGWTPDNPEKMEKNVDLPGLDFCYSKDMPLVIIQRPEPYYKHAKYLKRAAGVVINTFEEFEKKSLATLRQQLQIHDTSRKVKVFPIGPLLLNPEISSSGKENGPVETNQIIKWLDTRPNASVLFICFGSFKVLTPTIRLAIAQALDTTKVSFLWALRLSEEEESSQTLLPSGFLERTQDRGMVATYWVPQQEILLHPSLGGFLSHCGWNSILESVKGGVPILTFPMYAEQAMNARHLIDEMKVAVKGPNSENEVDGTELAKAIKALMEDRDDIRENMVKAKEDAFAAVAEGGSSHQNILKVFAEIF